MFQRESARYLRDVYLPRLRRAVETLPEADLWWRPHDGANGVGNLLVHLEGNVRQWIVSGVGGAPDRRRRPLEFSRREGGSRAELLDALEATVGEACAVIERLPDDELQRPRTIQGSPRSVFGAIYHVVEHFSWHTGQVAYVAKMRAGPAHGIAFYDDSKL
ncbi:MAG: DinB family protein [Planctomycetota bacterium]